MQKLRTCMPAITMLMASQRPFLIIRVKSKSRENFRNSRKCLDKIIGWSIIKLPYCSRIRGMMQMRILVRYNSWKVRWRCGLCIRKIAKASIKMRLTKSEQRNKLWTPWTTPRQNRCSFWSRIWEAHIKKQAFSLIQQAREKTLDCWTCKKQSSPPTTTNPYRWVA